MASSEPYRLIFTFLGYFYDTRGIYNASSYGLILI